MCIFVTSDLHRGHKNILKYCDRPYKTLEEMEDAIVNSWNQVVTSDDDTVYILGDLSIDNNKEKNVKFLKRLRGKKIVIKGNHDESALLNYLVAEGIIESWHYALEVRHNKCKYFLSHFPVVNPRGMFNSNTYYSIHGHLHGVKRFYTALNSIDVGWDVFQYPVPLDTIPSWIKRNVENQSPLQFLLFGIKHVYFSLKSLYAAKRLIKQNKN